MMALGFAHACKAGISFGKDDLVIPEAKKGWSARPRSKVKEYEQQYIDGLITKGEKYNKVVDIWSILHRTRRRRDDEGDAKLNPTSSASTRSR